MYAGLRVVMIWTNCFFSFNKSFLLRKVEDVATISKPQSLTSVRLTDCNLRVPNKTTEALHQSVVLFCFLQLAVFCVIFVFKQSSAEDLASSIVLHSLALNSSSVVYKHGNGSHPLQRATVADT